ncbi:MAG: SpaA isopeptide-forming pilin-related protein [Planctomycetota bacterium]|nr:SpaA isopeptide-forming pilin-related protein [Planctomycetota bacterium]
MRTLRKKGIGSHRGGISVGVAARHVIPNLVEPLEGRCLLSAIAGTVFMDSNDNGVLNDGEPGIMYVTVTLQSVPPTTTLPASATTDDNGAYSFDHVPKGEYVLMQTRPGGYLDSVGGSNQKTVSVVDDNTVLNGNDFADIIPSSVAGFVYVIATADADPASRQPLPGVVLTLSGTNDRGQAVQLPATTDAEGAYAFRELRPGTYAITETQPTGYGEAAVTVGTQLGTAGENQITDISVAVGLEGVDNNFVDITPVTPPVIPPVQTITISGRTFEDVTGDGLTYADDKTLGGLKVKLFKDANGNGMLDKREYEPVAQTKSDAVTGAYSFGGLEAGAYFVKAMMPCKYVRTAPVTSCYYTVHATKGVGAENLDFAGYKKIERWGLKDVSYLINGVKRVWDLRNKVHTGDLVEASFTVKKGMSLPLSLVSYTAPSPVFVVAEAMLQKVFDSQSQVFGPGRYSNALRVKMPDGNFQVDFVLGSVLTQFGPKCSNIFYSPQERLISADNGGLIAKLGAAVKKLKDLFR